MELQHSTDLSFTLLQRAFNTWVDRTRVKYPLIGTFTVKNPLSQPLVVERDDKVEIVTLYLDYTPDGSPRTRVRGETEKGWLFDITLQDMMKRPEMQTAVWDALQQMESLMVTENERLTTLNPLLTLLSTS